MIHFALGRFGIGILVGAGGSWLARRYGITPEKAKETIASTTAKGAKLIGLSARGNGATASESNIKRVPPRAKRVRTDVHPA